MIKKIVLLALLLTASLFARERAEMTVTAIDSDGLGAILQGDEVQKGATGIVTTNLDGNKNTIVAALLANDSGTHIHATFQTLTQLAQDALPRAVISPKVGDKAIFYLFDNRSLVIARNQTDYQRIVSSEKKEWVHPDLFAAILTKERTGTPKKKDFQQFCKAFSIGTVYFALKDKLLVVDCQSFTPMQERPFSADSGAFKSPFYERTGDIETGYLGMMQESVKDFDSYYLDLLGK